MKLLISRRLPDAVMAEAAARFDLTDRAGDGPMSKTECIAALTEQDVVIPTLGDGFNAEVFAAVPEPRCKLLANFGVGYNHIDVAAAGAAGVAVTNTPGAVTDATADIALTLILMTARRAGEGERMVRAGAWTGWHPTQMLGLHVTGKTVAIIGMGRIGQAIARRCHFGFGCRIVYANRSEKTLDFPAERLPLAEAMAAADIVVLGLSASAETHHFIDAEALSAMRSHAILVNISRGDVIDEAALIAALQVGQIAGAGLDVYEFEPQVPDALKAMENVTLLPHLGTAALEVRENMGRMALENAIAFEEGRALPNLV
ncbi:D-glycerate dehydrogenase [Roseobacter sp. HKCCD9010]|uniref:2-hydroxyacid dehydrogenase n=1 Tax=unclassified Roseobacter TaxID=196798 RepID=UPI001491A46A|nr:MULTISPECIES: D-glycerate dehydrogenase [unclassified Roseobacter]MBF9051269.1 D-glycerate dehydrogenase [Rhodobacterales bacterium HKCCD4356]NNV13316.1 D-glycerate dehydrogenase [Roseobacter sp. HKCCD7357]NNV17567.1 D-glycerate dehydrogenase [Roseobacter sp. HKCCD8768]NNV27173.1 D-glycerate dehydrogenase [Roseobacter sp. HKCCD8192]NNV31293.1 D-glycerate dehydrogenase [Roseobacter sp. HKCCD9061]